MPHIVEPAVPEDLAEIEALLPRLADFEVPAQRAPEELWRGDRDLVRAWSKGNRPDVHAWVARADSGLLGVAVASAREEMLSHAPGFHLEILAVAEAAEGQGVGATLMAFVERAAREAGATMISLHVFSNNTRARRMYQRSGFDEEILRCVKALD